MRKFIYEMEISAPTEAEADTKMKGLAILGAKLSTKEVDKLAYIVEKDPIKTAMAKKALGV